MKVDDLNSYLRSLIEVPEPSVDRIIFGDPDMEVKKIGTCWLPYWDTCIKAVEAGVNTLVVHEPTFYSHRDLEDPLKDFNGVQDKAIQEYRELRQAKKDWLEENKLAIIRCHDVLDRLPEIGIPFALGKALGFGPDNLVRSRQHYNVYSIDPVPAREAAAMIAGKLKAFNHPGVAFYGDPDYEVKTIGVGTGCGCSPLHFADMDPDLYIAIDDSVRTWIETAYAADSGRPLVVINHGTSEEMGMRLLSDHLQHTFPDQEVQHFEQGCSYQFIQR